MAKITKPAMPQSTSSVIRVKHKKTGDEFDVNRHYYLNHMDTLEIV